jgi:hypothetical protein
MALNEGRVNLGDCDVDCQGKSRAQRKPVFGYALPI